MGAAQPGATAVKLGRRENVDEEAILAIVALAAAVAPAAWTSGPAQAAVKVDTVEYKQGDATLEGWLVYDDAQQGKRPGMVVFPAWNGPDQDEKGRAEMLAKLGYVAFVADVYGKGVRPSDDKGAIAESSKYMKDRPLLRQRAQGGVRTAAQEPDGRQQQDRGGRLLLRRRRRARPCAQRRADRRCRHLPWRLASPTPEDDKNIKGRVLVLHGADDPIVGPKDQEAFKKEMSDAKVDWTMILYSGAVHSFTQKGAGNDPSHGAAYNANADSDPGRR